MGSRGGGRGSGLRPGLGLVMARDVEEGPKHCLAAAERQGQMSGRTGPGPTWRGDGEDRGCGSRESQEAEIRAPTFSGYVGAGGQ